MEFAVGPSLNERLDAWVEVEQALLDRIVVADRDRRKRRIGRVY